MKIAIGSDHGGYRLKTFLIGRFQDVEFIDVGTSSEESCNYPDYAILVARKVLSGEADEGIVICGTGIGVSITADKLPGIRSALCCNEYMAEMAKRHNDANVLALGARVIGEELAAAIVTRWLEMKFEGGRHQKRLDIISALESEGK